MVYKIHIGINVSYCIAFYKYKVIYFFFVKLAYLLRIHMVIQWISVNRDSDKGDFRLIGIEIGKPFTT